MRASSARRARSWVAGHYVSEWGGYNSSVWDERSYTRTLGHVRDVLRSTDEVAAGAAVQKPLRWGGVVITEWTHEGRPVATQALTFSSESAWNNFLAATGIKTA